MSAPLYKVPTGGKVALAAATLTYVLGVRTHTNSILLLKEVWVSFDGVSASNAPVEVELCPVTWASNPPSTNSTPVTPLQLAGRIVTPAFTAAKTWTVAPTIVGAAIEEADIHPQAGIIYQIPLSDEYDCALLEGWVLRCTAAQTVNVRAGLKVVRA